ncbi:MAG: hypothetical protein KDH20_03385 [Rhodocyclaceae bacterium]|nr:hypothetical protein [Rhodocyclaceae bacterium]
MAVPKHVFEWFAESAGLVAMPWLILGKGPSFAARGDYPLDRFRILALNDCARECERVDIAHFIDFEAYERCAGALSRRPDTIVVLPRYPHFKNAVGAIDLVDLASSHGNLSRLVDAGRLFWYDLCTAPVRHADHPALNAFHFSSEAAFDLLASAGVRQVRSLGVDGGSTYSSEFSDLSSVSLLANGHKSFNRQFDSFASVISRTGVDYAPLGMETPIRIFVASSDSEALPVSVLEYSIRQHASSTVEVKCLGKCGITVPTPLAPGNRPRTPFSFQRFLIPEVCGFSGRAIYLDSDMLVFKDVVDLWQRPLDEANVLTAFSPSASGRKPQYSVMLMDCGRLDWDIRDIVAMLDSGDLSYEQLMYEFSLAEARAGIEPDWNSLETFKEGRTALLHYTDMHTQPWVSHLNPLGYLWVRTLRRALEDGAIPLAFVEDEVQKGHVRPSLLYQLAHEIDEAILLPRAVIAADARFTPPYRSLVSHHASPWENRLLWLRASLRAKYQSSTLYRLERHLLRRLAAWLE